MYKTPGVYIEEVSSTKFSVEAASTSIAAFLGHTRRGTRVTDKTGKPVLIRSLSQYGQQFGPPGGDPSGIFNEGLAVDAFGHAINAFFANGGAQAYVVPVARTDGKASACTLCIRKAVENADDVTQTLTFHASSPGKWADALLLRLEQKAMGTFTLTIGTQDTASRAETDMAKKKHHSVLETFTELSLDDGSPSSIEAKVNNFSSLVRVTMEPTTGDITGEPTNAQAEMTGTADTDAPRPADYTQALERLKDYRDIAIILLPGRDWINDKPVCESAITHAEFMKNRMVIVDPQNPQNSAKQLKTVRDVQDAALPVSSYGALYYPYLTVTNPYYNAQTAANLPETFEIGPSSIVAGVWARIDSAHDVWKAPAGREATVRGTQGPTVAISNTIQEVLNPLGVNCLRPIAGSTLVWGARTLASKTRPEYLYVPVRRTENMIRESLYNALQATVFETNDHALWSTLRAAVTDFMDGLYRNGAFQGSKSADAYFVQCGLGTTMTQADIDVGIVKMVVGFAALKPADFLIVKIQHVIGHNT